jgi:hypothetical protein
VLARLSPLIEERHNGCRHPVERAVFGLVLDFVLPDLSPVNRCPQIADELLGMMTGVDEAVVLTQQFLARIF